MKRLLLLVLVAMLLVSSVVYAEPIEATVYTLPELQKIYGDVLAEIMKRTVTVTAADVAAGDKEITFRNVAWGSNPATYLESLAAAEIKGNVRQTTPESWEWKLDDGDLERVNKLKDAGYYIQSSPKNLMVAGYPVSGVNAYFLYTFDDEDVYGDAEKAAFYRADYTFNAVDNLATYEMLKAKLTALYGESMEESDSTHWWSTGGDYTEYVNATVWYGTNDTAVVLWHNYGVYDSDGTYEHNSLKLSYGKSNSLVIMQELQAAMAREQLEMAASNMDGL